MLNAILLLGSSYNKYKKVSFVLLSIMILRLLFIQTNAVADLFTIVNVALLVTIPLLINRIQNEKTKKVLSIFSIIIWSILIDVISYFMLPQLVGGASLFTYMLRGLIFNSKYLISNTLIIIAIEIIEKTYNKISNSLTKKAYNKVNA